MSGQNVPATAKLVLYSAEAERGAQTDVIPDVRALGGRDGAAVLLEGLLEAFARDLSGRDDASHYGRRKSPLPYP